MQAIKMRELPILFNTPMVQAILDMRKTQTRRIIKPQPVWMADPNIPFKTSDANPKGIIKSSYQIRDMLYVRETWQSFFPEEVTENHQQGPKSFSGIPAESAKGHYMYFYYKADGEIENALWRPSIHMPKEAARIWLEVTDVRAERVQEITDEDAMAEGIESLYGAWRDYKEVGTWHTSPRASFSTLWDSIYQKQGHGWGANPWVWVYEFKRLEGYRWA